MNRSNISDKQKDIVCDEIAKVVYDLKKDDNIEAITMFYYKKMDKTNVTNQERIRLNVIIKYYDEDTFNKIEELNNYCRTHNPGVKLLISYQFRDLYDGMDHYKILNELYNSIILFDRNDNLSKIKNIIKTSKEENYTNWLYDYKNAINTDMPIRNIR